MGWKKYFKANEESDTTVSDLKNALKIWEEKKKQKARNENLNSNNVVNIPNIPLTTSNPLIVETKKMDEIIVDYIAQSDEQQEVELPTGLIFIRPHIGGRVVAWRNNDGIICLNMMPPDNVKTDNVKVDNVKADSVKAKQEIHSEQETYSKLKDEDFD